MPSVALSAEVKQPSSVASVVKRRKRAMSLVIVVFRFRSTSIASCRHWAGGWLGEPALGQGVGLGLLWREEDGLDSVAGTAQ